MTNSLAQVENRYGKRTANIVSDILAGYSAKKIAARRHVKISTVRTTVGNFTRGCFDKYID